MPDSTEKSDCIQTYRRNIFRLRDMLSGKSAQVVSQLQKDMRQFAREDRFEEAALVRSHIERLHALLQKRYDPMLYIASDQAVDDIYQRELTELQTTLAPYVLALPSALHRIECIDISNIEGRQTTGSLVVLTDGVKDTREYKRFRMKVAHGANDFEMIAQVVKRRFSHTQWPKPDLLIIDGGKGQVRSAVGALSHLGISLTVVGIAKRYEDIIVPIGEKWKVIRLPLTSGAIHVITRIRDEAHRFALRYHRLLRKKEFLV